MDEVERLNRMLQTGQVPGREDLHNGTASQQQRPPGNNSLTLTIPLMACESGLVQLYHLIRVVNWRRNITRFGSVPGVWPWVE